MGREYSHGIFVADLTWRPTWKHAIAVRKVLVRWKFDDEVSYMVDDEEIDEDSAREMPNNLLMVATGPDGTPAATLMGPSLYENVPDDDRYIVSATLYFGSAWKVVAYIEGDETDVTTPPSDNGQPIAADTSAELHPSIVYPASWESTSPVTNATGEFNRVWRCGLILSCDKDVPAIATAGNPLPSRFARDIETALGTKVVELGWHE